MMQAYAEYKDSGVDWLGEIPAGWDVKRVQDVATYNDDVVDEIAYKRREIKYVDISSVSSVTNSYQFEEMLFSSAPSRAKRLINSGDTIFSTVRPYLKAVATIQNPESNLVVSTGFAVARPRKETNARFLGYLLRNEAFIDEVSANSVGASYPAINASDLFKIKTPFTDTSVQTAIADFLDDKTAKIEALVGIKRRQIELLKERKQILIQNAVTKGLNPDAPMKDSGVEWIGTIPAGWEVRRSKFVFTQRKDLARKDDIQLSATQSYGVIPQEQYERLVGRRVVRILTNLEKRKHVELDDFVISMRSFQGGLERTFASGCIRSSYIILQPLEKICPDFFGLLFKSSRYIKALQTTGNFIRDGQDLNFENFSGVDLYLPPIEEQLTIAVHIHSIREKINAAIKIKENQIAKLNEYKTTLINAAVTGKIKVT